MKRKFFFKLKLKMATYINNIGLIVNGRFEVLKHLGKGGQGEVSAVKDLNDDYKMYSVNELIIYLNSNFIYIFKRKAVKTILKAHIAYEKSKEELKLLEKINSDYIVKYLGFEENESYLYIIMQLYEVI